MKTNTRKTNRSALSSVIGGLLAMLGMVLWTAAPPVFGQSVVNPGFDGPNNLANISALVNPLTAGLWGVESATVTSAGYVTAHSPSNMLSLASNFGNYTEAWQFFDIGSGSSRQAGVSAWFDAQPSNSIAVLSVLFYAAETDWGNEISSPGTSQTLDANPLSWQQVSLANVSVPDSATWAAVHVGFDNASLGGTAGVVDDVQFSISSVPEPSISALMTVGCVLGIFFNRLRRLRN